MKIRIKFSKHGPMKFIGHLDIMRYFQKAIRRAGIDIAYSSGFSPHQIMSFAAPLGVGLESDGEYLDIEVCTAASEQALMQALNAVMAEGICVLSIKKLPDNAKNAMASVAAAGYLVGFRQGKELDFPWQEKLISFLQKDAIVVMKQTKKSCLEYDLKPHIYALEIKGSEIFMLLDASSAGNIKPRMVMDAFMAEQEKSLEEHALLITRTDTFANAGTLEAPVFVPLEDLGESF